MQKSKSYWKRTWSLSNEISEIPRPLWHDMIFQMASQRRTVMWRMNAAANGTIERDTFPLCNSVAGIVELAPSFKSVKNALEMSSSYCVK